jgi:hypothetical protein
LYGISALVSIIELANREAAAKIFEQHLRQLRAGAQT